MTGGSRVVLVSDFNELLIAQKGKHIRYTYATARTGCALFSLRLSQESDAVFGH